MRVTSRRTSRLLRSIVLVGVLALGAACSDDGGTEIEPEQTSAEALEAGLAAHTAGDLDRAQTLYETALTLDPQNGLAYYNLALIDVAEQNVGLAKENYEKALEIDPEYIPALRNLAILLTDEGRTDEAIALYRRAVEADPENAPSWFNLGLLLRATGDTAGGDQAIATAIGLDPTLVDPAGP